MKKRIRKMVVDKQKEVNYWRNKCYILTSKFGKCQNHDEINHNDIVVSFDDYVKRGVECVDCNYNQLKKRDEQENK